jgi:hypothetical protein
MQSFIKSLFFSADIELSKRFFEHNYLNACFREHLSNNPKYISSCLIMKYYKQQLGSSYKNKYEFSNKNSNYNANNLNRKKYKG